MNNINNILCGAITLAVKELVHTFMKSNNFWVSLARDMVYAFTAVAAIALVLYLYAGVWPPLVSVDGTSMYPHLQDGDLILIQGLDRTNIVTYNAAQASNYTTFGNYGNVIVYQPFGLKNATPVIHRAMYYVSASEPMWQGGISAPESGYITKGDNNFLYDQASGVCPNAPVPKSWILGVARARIPYLGYIRSIFSLIHL
jgi:signal peptidase